MIRGLFPAGALGLALWLFVAGGLDVGLASRYDVGVFPATVELRLQWEQVTQDQVDRVDGFAAVLDCDRIGEEIYVLLNDGRHLETGELVDGGDWQLLLVADCAVRDDSDGARSWMIDNGILLEIDGELALRYGWDDLRPVSVVVSEEPPILNAHDSSSGAIDRGGAGR